MLAPKAGEVEERDNSRGVWCEVFWVRVYFSDMASNGNAHCTI